MVYRNKADADRVATCILELGDLANKVTDNPLDLFDHCLCKDFCLGAYLNICNRASSNKHSFFGDRRCRGDKFSKCAIPSAGFLNLLSCSFCSQHTHACELFQLAVATFLKLRGPHRVERLRDPQVLNRGGYIAALQRVPETC